MAFRSLRTTFTLAGIGTLIVLACGTETGDTTRPSGSGSGSGGTSAGGSSSGGTSAGGSSSGGSAAGIAVDGGGSDGLNECAGETIQGELIPLDIYVMLDTSHSMVEPDPTKWAAVKQALTSFLQDTGSAGLGVGIQFFPLKTPGVVEQCRASAECNGGICVLKTCYPSEFVTPCDSNADCMQGQQSCVDLGVDCVDNSQFCVPPGNRCSPAAGGCVRLAGSYCTNYWSCDNGAYATPAVEIAALPRAAQPLIASINAQTPLGRTPTSAALRGAIDHAGAWARQNASHRVVVLLATDGLPTECDPTDIPQIAQIAGAGLRGAPSITTFVIGVFAPADAQQGQANLDTIAASGGSQRAIIVDASQNVSRQFLDALNAIRGSSVACEFHIPTPRDGRTLDYGKVNMLYTSSSGTTTTLYYVGSAANCDPQQGGWYYDVDPKSGATPSKMIVCDSNCGTFKASGGQVDVKMGCQTVIQPPR